MTSATADTTAQLQYMHQGGPFKIVHVPKPTLAPGEVLIQQRVIAFNLIDVKQRDLGLLIPSWPHVLGIEGGGVIEAVGADVHDLQPGDEVAGVQGGGAHEVPWGGAFQERVAVPASLVAKKPANISLAEATSLPVGFVTAVCGIVHSLQIPLPFLHGTSTAGQPPASILVLGGSSATGAAAIQLLRKAYPALPILATSSLKHRARLHDLGATHVVDYKAPSVVANLKAASPGAAGVDVILDCVSAGASQTDICDVFDAAGSKKYAAVITSIPVPVPDGVVKLDVRGWSITEMQGGMQLIPSLTKLVEDGTYRVPLPVRVVGHGLEQLPDVLDEVKTVSGEKVVVTL
ncbi:putative quinone oxidoreductase [Mytilinidion resinicola]|uniref:Quinone oxidoreductase n=1 Tax=Mytilinidion resinicola TaxID=574789 RepID=A0A6A6Y1G9_9PEZI|nr:putative quinone oxidoreductase [Mytilinidion resinicola]KAF2802622.1 putative quinone oxidoreductase [Mytilinidion resinicola]